MLGYTELRHKPFISVKNDIQIDRYGFSILVVAANHSIQMLDNARLNTRPIPKAPKLQVESRLECPGKTGNGNAFVLKHIAFFVDQDRADGRFLTVRA